MRRSTTPIAQPASSRLWFPCGPHPRSKGSCENPRAIIANDLRQTGPYLFSFDESEDRPMPTANATPPRTDPPPQNVKELRRRLYAAIKEGCGPFDEKVTKLLDAANHIPGGREA